MSWLPGARTTGPCLGDVAAALIDGELSHAERERAHRHLTHCPACLAEVEAERQLKLRLHGLTQAPAFGELLSARLLAIGTSEAPLRRAGAPHSRRDATGPPAARPRGRSSLARSPLRPSAPRRFPPRRGTLGGAALVALGLTAVIALRGGAEPPSTSVEPGIDAFVTQYVVSKDGVAPARQVRLTTGGGVQTGP